MRTLWRGAIGFGLVSVPVRLYSGVQSRSVRFRQLSRMTGAPVRQRRIDARTGDEVAADDIVKGFEVTDGHYVRVEPEELEALAPGPSRVIDIRDFVRLADIDPVYYDRPYLLAPDGDIAVKPYRLLTEAMRRTERVAVAEFVMRGRGYLGALRARGDVLVLSTMHYGDEVVDPEVLEPEAWTAQLTDREVGMAEQLIRTLDTTFDPAAYRDEYRARVLEFVQARAAGNTVRVEDERHPGADVVDLMAALEQSLQGAGAAPVAGSTRGQSGGGDPSDYDRMSRDQLYALARERDIPGRSALSKTELVEALRSADEEPGAA